MSKFITTFACLVSAWSLVNAAFYPRSGTVVVFQNDTGNTPQSVSLSLSAATSPGVRISYDLANRADYPLTFPGVDAARDGVLLSSVAQNGRNNADGGSANQTFYATSSVFADSDRYYIATHAAPSGDEFNINTAFAWFSYADWLGAFTTNAVNGGRFSTFAASPGVAISDANDGTSQVTLPGGAGPQHGILLVNSAENEDNFALGFADTANDRFLIVNHDNGINGAIYELDSSPNFGIL